MKNSDVKIIYTEKEDGNMNLIDFRQKFLEKNNLTDKKQIVVQQIHGDKILNVDKNYSEVQDADGMITNDKEVALFTRTSDCLPILFFDPNKQVIAAVHAGREGTFKKIAQKTVEKFVKEYESKPQEIQVEIGPSICNLCYEIDREVDKQMVEYVKDNFGEEFLFESNNPSKINIDLKEINKKQLIESGILEENLNIVDHCTKCSGDKHFSYRRDPNKGNFASVIYFK